MAARRFRGFKSILCPVDFSEQSGVALQYAAVVARRASAPLSTFYVNDPLLVAAASAALHDQSVAATSLLELRRFAEAHLRPRDRDRLTLREAIAIGAADKEILKAARSQRSDLIVVGAGGLTGPQRLLMGSTTLSILQRSTVPVLAIPRAEPGVGPARPDAAWPGRTVIVAVELDASTRSEIEAAADVAAWFGCSLLIVHVVEPATAPAWLTTDLTEHQRARRHAAEQKLARMVAHVAKGVRSDVRVVAGKIRDEVRAIAAAEKTQLVITMLRERHGWFGARRGSVSYDVLTHAVTPVLAVPPRWRRR